MILAISGYILWVLVLIINYAFYYQLSADYLLFDSLASFGGQFMGFAIGTNGYLSDVSTAESRTTRLAILDATFSVAFTLG